MALEKKPNKGLKGMFNRFLSKHVETILSIPGAKLYKKFVEDTKHTADVQDKVMHEIINYGRDSVFGKQYNFSNIKKYKDFKNNIPTHNYEALRPYVDRHTKGEENVLFPGKPLMYNQTSGTTDKSKLIPITQYAFDRTIKDRGKLWMYGIMKSFPGIFKGKDLTLISPAVQGHTEDGTPFGSLSGLMYQNIPEFVKLVHTVPYSVFTVKDYKAKIYTLMRFAMAHNITCILTGNPSTVLNLVTRGNEWKEDIIRDIHDGTLNKDLALDPEIRAETEALLKPNPKRAKQLRTMIDGNNMLRPADYWPNLRLIHTWSNGNCRLQIPKLDTWFRKETPVLDFGYIASEINATDIIDSKTSGSVLQIQNAFYEFSPYEDEEKKDKRYYRAHELEVGKQYFIYITTFNGLYRYNMNDVLKMIGHFNDTPLVKFMHKGQGVTSIQGEKLSEDHVIEAIGSASKETGINHDFFFAYANAEASRYQIYIDFLDREAKLKKGDFGNAVDRALSKVNVEYEAKRKSERLKAPEIIPLIRGAFDQYHHLRLGEGAHEGQIKWIHLSGTDVDKARMQQLADES